MYKYSFCQLLIVWLFGLGLMEQFTFLHDIMLRE